jgi:hypothetical protein
MNKIKKQNNKHENKCKLESFSPRIIKEIICYTDAVG